MRKAIKILILALFIDAAVVFVLQVAKNSLAWVFIVLYWGILTIKNCLDWLNGGKK